MSKQKNIEAQLSRAIEKSAMTRYQISQLSGVGQAQLSLFVNGKRTLTLTSAAKVAEVLGFELKQRRKPKGGSQK